ncbi:hypothetical protein, partial [Massilia sp. YIM B04103]|uniref:hypothetical protein n=1 Tax=Massilia sp. YIM B04103 TaxID=2963106 RepID=UPI00210AEE8E
FYQPTPSQGAFDAIKQRWENDRGNGGLLGEYTGRNRIPNEDVAGNVWPAAIGTAAGIVALRNTGANTSTSPRTRNLINDPEELDFVLSGGKKDWSFYREVESSKGPIEIKSKSYRVDEDAASLLINEVHVFPKNQPNLKLGFREVKSLFQSLVDDLGSVGFETVTIQGQRISGAKFINNAPNKTQSITLTPRKPGQP